MKVKMIRDKGSFKKGEIYDINNITATALLTEGYCIRVKVKNGGKTIKEVIDININSKNSNKTEEVKADEPNQFGFYESDSQPDYNIGKRKKRSE